MNHLIRTIDAHVGGQALRLIVEGATQPSGATLAQRADWLRRHADRIRKGSVLPPRGDVDLVAAQLVDAVTPGTHAGILFMDAHGYRPISGHGIIAATTIAIERELFYSRSATDSELTLVFDTAAGSVQARARLNEVDGRLRVGTVTFTNVPSFVYMPGYPVNLGSRELRVDIAFGGRFYAIADTEAVGIPLTVSRLPELRRLGMDVARAVNGSLSIAHPTLPAASVAGVVFTGPPQNSEAHLRAICVSDGGTVNWSPGATGMSAVMSVLDAMQLLPEGAAFVQEGLSGAVFEAQTVARTMVGELPAVVTEIEAQAWITGEHTFFLDESDPFRDGMVRA